MKSNNAYLKLTLAIISWAGVYHAANYLVRHLDMYSTAFIRYLIASIILLIILKIKRGRIFDKELFKSNWLLLISVGVVGIGLYNLAFFGAEKYLTANMVVLIFSFSPCLTAFMASIVFRQKIPLTGYLSMLVALSGTIGVINYANPACGKFFCTEIFTHLSIGEVYALFLCLFAAIFSLMNRKATQRKIDSLTITSYAAVFGCIVLFFSMLMFGNISEITHQSINFWLVMAYTSIIGSVAAYFWYSEAIGALGVPKVVVALNAIPFTTLVMSVIFFNQKISLSIIICGMIIITGVILTNLSLSKK
jgi:drug/metabolite transporter (DMT)-like permease